MSEALAIALMIVLSAAVFIGLCAFDGPISHEVEDEARASIEDYYRSERERKALMDQALQKYLGEDD